MAGDGKLRKGDGVDLRERYLDDKKSIREIASIFKMSYNGIRKRMIRAGIERRTISEGLIVKCRTRPTDPNLNLAMTPNLAYILGVCYGDGSVCRYYDKWSKGYRYVISLEVPEKELALSFKAALEKHEFKPKLSYYLPKNVYRVRQYSKGFYNWFKAISLGDLTNLFQDASYATGFIRGFYESEGCLYHGTDIQLSIANTNLEVLKLIGASLKRGGISCSLSELSPNKWRKKRCYRLHIGRRSIALFLKTINPRIKTFTFPVLEKIGGFDD